MGRRRILWQLYVPYLLIVLVSVMAVAFYAFHVQRSSYERQVRELLLSSARLVVEPMQDYLSLQEDRRALRHAQGLQSDREASAEAQATAQRLGRQAGVRVTVILPDGRVVADSDEEPARMDNHAARPEVRQALAGRIGYAERYSRTVSATMMYAALPVHGGDGALTGVVRTGIALTHIEADLARMYLHVLLVGLAVAAGASAVVWLVSRRLSRPLEGLRQGAARLARGDLSVRLPVPDSEEIAALAEALNQMARELSDRIDRMTRQRNELQAVLASMAEGVFAVDREERVLSLNRAAAELLDIQTMQIHGRPIQELVRNADLLRFVARALAVGEAVEGDLVFREPAERYIQARASVLHDAAGRAIGALVVLNDVTRLRRLENIRRDFVANVSHEIRTPITSIKGFVETLLEGALQRPDDAARFLTIIAKQADRLGAIIDDLLALSRIEEEGQREAIALEPMPLRSVLAAALENCQPAAHAKRIALELTCSDDLSARLNSATFEQAVINLIDNAVKYSDAGTRVQVTAEKRDGEVVVRVIDQGCGIPAEHLPRLFERFYRVDKARSRKLGGTGLGLAIVKHIVQAHKGRIEVESTPGQGSTFSIYLPA
ncbi:HAMP domain-containing protein [bacterium]|nr:HAMP domain-containing protein [bacterium]